MENSKQHETKPDQQQIASLQTSFTKMSVDLFQEGFGRGILNVTDYAKTKQQQPKSFCYSDSRKGFVSVSS